MYREIKPIGRFFPIDKKGNILNDASLEKIPVHWLPVIERIKLAYQQQLGNQLVAIYIRGSVPRGLVVDGFSDLDTFALVKGMSVKWKSASWEKDLELELQKEFVFVKNVEVMLSEWYDDFHEKNPRLSMIIKTQSVCIFGNNVSAKIPLFFPNKKMILNLTWLEKDIEGFLKKGKINQKDCQEMMKVILRSGFELVMEKEKEFTTDLYLCYTTFAKHFPKKEKIMKEVLELYLNPKDDFIYLKKIVNSIGVWIVEESEARM